MLLWITTLLEDLNYAGDINRVRSMCKENGYWDEKKTLPFGRLKRVNKHIQIQEMFSESYEKSENSLKISVTS
jgi:hypothetical protein